MAPDKFYVPKSTYHAARSSEIESRFGLDRGERGPAEHCRVRGWSVRLYEASMETLARGAAAAAEQPPPHSHPSTAHAPPEH